MRFRADGRTAATLRPRHAGGREHSSASADGLAGTFNNREAEHAPDGYGIARDHFTDEESWAFLPRDAGKTEYRAADAAAAGAKTHRQCGVRIRPGPLPRHRADVFRFVRDSVGG